MSLWALAAFGCSNKADDCEFTATCPPEPGTGGNGGSAGNGAAGSGGDGGETGSGGIAGAAGAAGIGGEGGEAGSGPELPDAVFVEPGESISDAIDAALARDLDQVVLCDGAYDEHVVISDPITLVGGYDCNGSEPVPDESARPVVAPADPGYALLVDNIDGPVLIEGIEFQAADATEAGESSIAAFVRGSTDVTFRDVRLIAGNGADGEAGGVEEYTYETPSNGNAGSATSGGTFVECTCPDGSTTSGGLGGSPSPGGAGGGLGTPDLGGGAAGLPGEPCAGPGTGGDGATGTPGDDGTGAETHGTLTEGGWTPESGADGTSGTPGQGGGGGASTSTSGGGGGGCGGCPGAGAAAGTGGGSSIALLVFESTVTVESSELTSRDGGKGGDGTAGQTGQTETGYGGNPAPGACQGGAGAPGGDGGASGAPEGSRLACCGAESSRRSRT